MKWLASVAVLMCCFCGAAAAIAQGPQRTPADEPREPIKYRRLYVPQDELQAEIRGLLPLKREEFERRMASVAQSDSDADRSRIGHAVYRSSFENGQLRGTADLDIETATADTGRWVSFEPCNLAISKPVWDDERQRPAILGLTAAGRTILEVEEASKLHLNWSLQGRGTPNGEWRFDLKLPAATRNELQIDLPAAWSIACDGAIVRRLTGDPMQEPRGDEAATSSSRQTWVVELGAHSAAMLVIAPPLGTAAEANLLVSDSVAYRFSPGNLDADATLTLEVHKQALKELALKIDPPLEVMSIRHGDQRLTWHEGAPDEAGVRRLMVELPEPLAVGQRTINVAMSAPFPMDTEQLLPRIHVENAVWQKGEASLTGPAGIRLEARALEGAHATSASLAIDASQANSHRFDYFVDSGKVAVSLSRFSPGLRATSGLSIAVDNAQTTATFIADLATDEGERFDFVATASRRWVIESVETVPADLLEDRSIAATGADEQRLFVRLRHPLVDNKSARLIVRARRQKPAEDVPLGMDFFTFLRFSDAREHKRFVSIASLDASIDPKLIADSQLKMWQAADLSPAELSLFESSPGPILFDLRPNSSDAKVTFSRGEPSYLAEIEVVVHASPTRLDHEARIELRPESSIASVLVRATPAPTSDLVWSIEGEDSAGLVVTRLKAGEDDSPEDHDEGLWLIQFKRPHSTATTLIGRWSEAFGRRRRLPLFSVPEAAAQRGIVEIISADEAAILTESVDVVALPAPQSPPAEFSRIRGRYQYDPGRRAEVQIAAVDKSQTFPSLVIRSQRLRSVFADTGVGTHEVVFELENLGAERFELQLADTAEIVRAAVDGKAVRLPRHAHLSGTISIPLPNALRNSTVELSYTSAAQTRASWPAFELVTPLPIADLPVLDKVWVVRLAPGLKFWKDENAGAPATGVSASSRPFNLLSRSAWSEAVASLWANRHDRNAAGATNATDSITGWSEHEVSFPDSSFATLSVYRPAPIQALSVAIFLAALAIGSWNVQPGRLRWTLAFVLLAFALFLVPTPLAPIFFGALAGMVLARGRLLTRLRGNLLTRTSDPQSARTAILAKATCILFAVVTAVCASSTADAKQPTRNATEKLVIPVDKDGMPAGEYVYASQQLYDWLQSDQRDKSEARYNWLLRSAEYDLRLLENDSPESPRRMECTAQFEIDSSRDDVEAALPLGGEIHLVEGAASLDGKPLAISKNPLVDEISFEIPTAGSHHVELRFLVELRPSAAAERLELSIPRLANSRALLSLSNDDFEIEPSGAMGAVYLIDEETLIAELGTAGVLRVDVSRRASDDTPKPQVTVDQLVWWKARANSVLADGRFVFRSNGGELRRLSIQTDPRLRLLPLSSTTGISRQWTEQLDGMQVVHFDLSAPYPEDAELHASFLLMGAAGSGNVTLAKIVALGDRLQRDWQAVSVAPGWSAHTDEATLDSNEFARAWGSDASLPQLAWDAVALSKAPRIVVRPSQDIASAKEAVEYVFGRDLASLRYTAKISGESGGFQHVLDGPSALRVHRVGLFGAEGPIASQWWQKPNGQIVVVTAESSATDHRLEIEAEWEHPRAKAFRLPLLKLAQVESESYEVSLYRRPDAWLRVASHEGFHADDATLLGGYEVGRGRLAGRFSKLQDSVNQDLNLRVDENSPAVAGQMVTVMDFANDSWQVELHCDLEVRDGVLDTLRFDVPDNWSGPFHIEPAVDHAVLSVPGKSRKQLVIRPQKAANGPLQLVVKGRLETSAAELVRAPNIELSNAPDVVRYIAVAESPNGRASQWETTGLQATGLEDIAWPPRVSVGRYELFRIVAHGFTAAVSNVASANERPLVQLADIEVTWRGDRRTFGQARFDLQPAGLGECVINCPPDCRIASVTIDGVLAETMPIGHRAIGVNLGQRVAPVELEVVFSGRLPIEPQTSGMITLACPTLEGIDVVMSVWRVHSPSGVSTASVIDGSTIQPADGDLVGDFERLKSLVSVLEGAAERQSSRPLGDGDTSWANRIQRRYQSVVQRIQLHSAGSKEDETTEIVDQLPALVDRWNAARHALQLASPNVPSASETGAADAQDAANGGESFVAVGPTSSLQLKVSSPSTSRHFSSSVAWLVLLAALVVIPWMSLNRVADWAEANPALLLALIGLIAWWTLPFGGFGWLLIAGAVFVAILIPRPISRFAIGN